VPEVREVEPEGAVPTGGELEVVRRWETKERHDPASLAPATEEGT
jgi:hypothetical protein